MPPLTTPLGASCKDPTQKTPGPPRLQHGPHPAHVRHEHHRHHPPPVHDIHSIDQLLEVLDPIISPTTRGLTLSIHIEARCLPKQAEAARIRFKTEVLERKRELQHSVPLEDVRALLDPADALLQDHEFWNHQLGGLSYFANQEQCMVLRCARRFPTLSRFGGDYHLLPLLEAAAMARRFHLLALSEHSSFLLRISDLGFELIPGIPESFAAALRSTGFTAERLEEKEFSNHNNRASEHSRQALRAIHAAVLLADSPKSKLPLHLREDLVDFAARRCLADGGELVFVEPEALPDDTPLLAETRWTPVHRT